MDYGKPEYQQLGPEHQQGEEHAPGERGKVFKFKKKYIKCCCCKIPRGLWLTCCCCCYLIIIIAIALGAITAVNVSKCDKLNVDGSDAQVQTIAYDPTKKSGFRVEASGVFKRGQIRLIQGNSTAVRLLLHDSKRGNTNVVTRTDVDNFVLELRQGGKTGATSFLQYWTLPPKCTAARVDITLPRQSNTEISTNIFDISVEPNTASYENLKLTSNVGDISLKDVHVSAAQVNAGHGDLTGTIINLEDSLTAESDNGDIKLRISIDAASSPKIDVQADRGDVNLDFGNTFFGGYTLQTEGGDVRTSLGNNRQGTVGNGESSLDVKTEDGDITVIF